MIIIVLLALLLLTAVAAICNVISASVGLGVIPGFPGDPAVFAVKTYLADALLWMIVLTGATMALAIYRDRRHARWPALEERDPLPADPNIVVVLTAYNDAESIGAAVTDFRSQPNVSAVLVVDNNCRDETAFVAARAGARVVQEKRQGYGFACMRGLREALAMKPDVVVLSEGDGTFAGRDVSKLVVYLDDADMVVGNRITPGLVDRNSQMDSFFIWGNQIGAKLIQLKFWEWRFLGRTRLSDLGCTMRALRSDALESMIDDLQVGGMHFSPDMIMAALRRGLLVVEVPITFWPRVGVSKGASQSLRAGAGIGLSMLWHIASYPTHPLPHWRTARKAREELREAA
jgi:hypothetical protein